jgi:hypothetical protein
MEPEPFYSGKVNIELAKANESNRQLIPYHIQELQSSFSRSGVRDKDFPITLATKVKTNMTTKLNLTYA